MTRDEMQALLNPLSNAHAAKSFVRHFVDKLASEKKMEDFLDFIESTQIDFDNLWWERLIIVCHDVADRYCDHIEGGEIAGYEHNERLKFTFCPKCGKKL